MSLSVYSSYRDRAVEKSGGFYYSGTGLAQAGNLGPTVVQDITLLSIFQSPFSLPAFFPLKA